MENFTGIDICESKICYVWTVNNPEEFDRGLLEELLGKIRGEYGTYDVNPRLNFNEEEISYLVSKKCNVDYLWFIIEGLKEIHDSKKVFVATKNDLFYYNIARKFLKLGNMKIRLDKDLSYIDCPISYSIF